jgi:hypothetical protein
LRPPGADAPAPQLPNPYMGMGLLFSSKIFCRLRRNFAFSLFFNKNTSLFS